jgi:transposase
VLLVQRIEQGWTPLRAAEAAGVSVRTAYRWLLRYRLGDGQLHSLAARHPIIAHIVYLPNA